MTFPQPTATLMAALLAAGISFAFSASAQEAQPRRGSGPQGPQFASPEVAPDRHVTFRILAPKAESVRLDAGDIPNLGRDTVLIKADNGVWEITVGPVEPGAYRYRFNIDDIAVVDPKSPATSESNSNTWSLVSVPGSEDFDTREVPHGAVAEVTYRSTSLKRFRRMHVYTPPGYESGEGTFPVLYLLHGASDSDDSWSTVGRAGFILDNLIAAGKAKPMVVVMPAGHTGPFRFGQPRDGSSEPRRDEFEEDFVTDIRPFVEKNYRVHADRSHRAIAGLSMGGGQSLNISIANLEDYGHIGVFSSGVFGIDGPGPFSPPGPPWEEKRQEALGNAKLREGLDLVWFATGSDDFLVRTSRSTVAMLKKHGFDVVYQETSGGHTWLNWRNYLATFAPLLFKGPVRSQGSPAATATD